MRRTLTALLLVVLLALPASAGAATRWVVKGGGWGHGVGLSQYGAYGLAQQGATYREILSHYYAGTQVSRAHTETIRVLLQANRSQASFTGASSAGGRALQSTDTYFVRAKDGGVELLDRKGKSL